MFELKCADCGTWHKVDEALFNRYMYTKDDFQCEKCFYAVRDKFFDFTIKAI